MMRKLFAAVGALALASSLSAAPGGKEFVAEGFVDWTNVTDKNLLAGLALTPGDLRQRTVVYVVVDDAWLTRDNLCKLGGLAGYVPDPVAGFSWDIQELEFKRIAVVSVRNGKGSAAAFAERLNTKGLEKDVAEMVAKIRTSRLPFYKDLAPADEAELTADRLPYVAVYAADSAEPVFKAEKFDFANMKDVYKATREAAGKFPADWTWPLGVREPQHCKTLPALVAKGKPATALQAALKASLKSKDPEVAKEAQVISDAINQYGTMLKLRIMREYRSAPARAYYDAATLVKMFPSEKKKIAAVSAKLKSIPEAGSLGKIMEKLMLWSRDDFAPKSAGDAKKIVAELKKIKKTLEELSKSENMALQGEAMLISSQLDSLIDIIPTKVPQK